jgi:hypothetical protein
MTDTEKCEAALRSLQELLAKQLIGTATGAQCAACGRAWKDGLNEIHADDCPVNRGLNIIEAALATRAEVNIQSHAWVAPVLPKADRQCSKCGCAESSVNATKPCTPAVGGHEPETKALLAAAVRAVIAQQRGTVVNYHGTEVRISRDADRGPEVGDLWIALEEAGLDVDELVALPAPTFPAMDSQPSLEQPVLICRELDGRCPTPAKCRSEGIDRDGAARRRGGLGTADPRPRDRGALRRTRPAARRPPHAVPSPPLGRERAVLLRDRAVPQLQPQGLDARHTMRRNQGAT